jgi:hypothetical protein
MAKVLAKFKVGEIEFPIRITYRDALERFPDRFGISLNEIFVDQDKMLETMSALLLDDEKTLGIMFYFMSEENASLQYEEFLDEVEEQELRQFRDKFWEAVTAFTGPLKAPMIKTLWSQLKKELKGLDEQALQKLISKESHTAFSQEESTSGDSLSEPSSILKEPHPTVTE